MIHRHACSERKSIYTLGALNCENWVMYEDIRHINKKSEEYCGVQQLSSSIQLTFT